MGGISGHFVWWIILMLARWISHLPWAFDNMTVGSYNILMLPPLLTFLYSSLDP